MRKPSNSMLRAILSWLHYRTAGYRLGGFLEYSRAIERRYLDPGGKIHYCAPVTEILVENYRAVGVRLADGATHRGDWVISAADGHTAIFGMLGGEYTDDEIRSCDDDLPVLRPLIHVALGVARIVAS